MLIGREIPAKTNINSLTLYTPPSRLVITEYTDFGSSDWERHINKIKLSAHELTFLSPPPPSSLATEYADLVYVDWAGK